MTEETKAPESTSAATPQVDIKAIEERVAAAAQSAAMKVAESKAAEIASAKLKEIGRQISGDVQTDHKKEYLDAFLTDPVRAIAAIAKKEVSNLREEQEIKNRVITDQQVVVGAFLGEYPDLNTPKKLAMVEKLAEQYEKSGMSYRDALRASCEDAVKELGLKSVKEVQAAQSYGGLPRGGGFTHSGTKPSFDDSKSNNDFIAAMQAKGRAVRHK